MGYSSGIFYWLNPSSELLFTKRSLDVVDLTPKNSNQSNGELTGIMGDLNISYGWIRKIYSW